MKIVFFTDHTYIPHRSGGRESSIHDLATRFVAHGWDVFVVSKRPTEKERHSKSVYFPYKVIELNDPFKSVSALSLILNVDRIIASVDGKNLSKFFEFFPGNSCLFVRDDQGLDAIDNHRASNYVYVANSKFTSLLVERIVNKSVPTFPPSISLGMYETISSREYVTFINPVEKKGLSTAIEIAEALPNIPFLFCEGWPQSDADWQSLVKRCSKLKNVRLERRTNDMREIYSRTKILIVPSTWAEAWGRVVTEAQTSGIPCVVRNIGGLQESCGIGGIVIPASSDSSIWISSVNELYFDEKRYDSFVKLALSQTKKYQSRIDNYIDDLISSIDVDLCDSIENSNLIKIDLKSNTLTHKDVAFGYSHLRNQLYMHDVNSADFGVIVFDFLYRLKLYDVIVYLKDVSYIRFSDSVEFLLACAIGYHSSFQYLKSISCWNALKFYPKFKPTPYQNFLAASAFEKNKDHSIASDYWVSAIVSANNEQMISWQVNAVNAILLGGEIDHLLKLSNFFQAKGGYVFLSNKIKAIAGYLVCEDEQVISFVKCCLDDFKDDISAEDCELFVHICFSIGCVQLAIQLSNLAMHRFSKSYRGPRDRFDLYNKRNDKQKSQSSVHDRCSNIHSNKVLVCSWPGVLTGNRYMQGFVRSIVGSAASFIPIDMPSDIVIPECKVFVIQFPDSILWKNRGLDSASMRALMYRELDSLMQWKLSGVKLVWVVHNFLPHDLQESEVHLWRSFFNILGSMVDEFFSLSPSNQLVIRKEIPSLATKRYGYFYHPPYFINKFSSSDIQKTRFDLGFSDDNLICGIFGSIGWYKGLKDIVEAFSTNSNDNARLLIVGQGRDEFSVSELKKVVCTDNRIVLIDKFLDDNLFDLYAQACDRMIVPNITYLNSGAIIYSLCAGKPLLALDRPYSRDIKTIFKNADSIVLVESFCDEKSAEFMNGGNFSSSELTVEVLSHVSILSAICS